jgi:hypothetical protein
MLKAKRAGSKAQVVEHLPIKCKSLSSNPILQNKQTNKPKTKIKLQRPLLII